MFTKRLIIFMVLFLSISPQNLCMENNKRFFNVYNFSPSYFWNTTTTFVSKHKKAFLIVGTLIVGTCIFIYKRNLNKKAGNSREQQARDRLYKALERRVN